VYICVTFRSGAAFEQVGRVQRLAIVDQENFPGTTGFNLTIKKQSKLSLTVAPGWDAASVLAAFQGSVGTDASVEGIAIDNTDCAALS
jgi:hypothetical protein